jgi:hypothetical protein
MKNIDLIENDIINIISTTFSFMTIQMSNTIRSSYNYCYFSSGGVVYLVKSSLPSTEETGAIGREIESRRIIEW